MENLDLALIRKVHDTLKERGMRISVAESCTGGLIAHALTFISGAGACFDSSVVCYSKHAKHRLLGLGESFLDEHGTVSEATTRAMAEAVKEKAGTDVSVAVTGVLGPQSIEGKEIGLVYIAVSAKNKTSVKQFTFHGKRDEAKHAAANSALQFLLDMVLA